MISPLEGLSGRSLIACRIAKQGHTSQGWALCLAQGLSTTLPGVSLLHSTVNFDHFQILRAIGKGSFGKVRKNLWVGQWRLGTCGITEPCRLAPSLLGEASPITVAKSSGQSGKKQGLWPFWGCQRNPPPPSGQGLWTPDSAENRCPGLAL